MGDSLRRRAPRQVGADIPVDIVSAAGSRAKDAVSKEVESLKSRLGIDEVGRLASEAAKAGDVDAARGMVSELREVTSEAILAYARRGFKVEKVGLDYQTALGGPNFQGAHAIDAEATPEEVVGAVISRTNAAWDELQKSVGKQAQVKVHGRAGKAKGKKEPEVAVMDAMRDVWKLKTEELVAGGRIETLRSGLGLRTLSALLARYHKVDSHGREDAAPKAYLWAERAYWLTKHSVQQLFRRPEYASKSVQLREIGMKYEEALGDSGLAKSSGGKIDVAASGWEVVKAAQEQTSEAWWQLKEIVP